MNGQEACGTTFGYPADVGDNNGVTWTFANSTDCDGECFGPKEVVTYPNSSGEGCCDELTELDICGIAPRIFYNKCTSIFYKDNNCLGI